MSFSAVGHFSYQAVVEPLVHCWYQTEVGLTQSLCSPPSYPPPRCTHPQVTPTLPQNWPFLGSSPARRGREVKKRKERFVSVISGWTQLWEGVYARAGHVEEKSSSSSKCTWLRIAECADTSKTHTQKGESFGSFLGHFVILIPFLCWLFTTSLLTSVARSSSGWRINNSLP